MSCVVYTRYDHPLPLYAMSEMSAKPKASKPKAPKASRACSPKPKPKPKASKAKSDKPKASKKKTKTGGGFVDEMAKLAVPLGLILTKEIATNALIKNKKKDAKPAAKKSSSKSKRSRSMVGGSGSLVVASEPAPVSTPPAPVPSAVAEAKMQMVAHEFREMARQISGLMSSKL
jgi:hypothetical protein